MNGICDCVHKIFAVELKWHWLFTRSNNFSLCFIVISFTARTIAHTNHKVFCAHLINWKCSRRIPNAWDYTIFSNNNIFWLMKNEQSHFFFRNEISNTWNFHLKWILFLWRVIVITEWLKSTKKKNHHHLICKKWEKENYSQTCICLTLKTWDLELGSSEDQDNFHLFNLLWNVGCVPESESVLTSSFFFFVLKSIFRIEHIPYICIQLLLSQCMRCTMYNRIRFITVSECDAFNLYCESFFCVELMVSNCRWTDICL